MPVFKTTKPKKEEIPWPGDIAELLTVYDREFVYALQARPPFKPGDLKYLAWVEYTYRCWNLEECGGGRDAYLEDVLKLYDDECREYDVVRDHLAVVAQMWESHHEIHPGTYAKFMHKKGF